MKRFLLVVLCIAVCGCTVDENGIGYSKDDAEYKWGEWGNKRLISIADDSLAVLAIYKYYFKEWHECGFEGCHTDMKITDSRVGLFLVNYREKQEPIWGDTLNYHLGVVEEYFRDSSVLVFDRNNNKFGFWKIGAKSVELVDYNGYYEGKEYRGSIYHSARPWANGNVLLFFKGEDPKLLLEVGNRQLRPFEFSGEYEWLSKCVNWWYYPSEPKIDYANISYIGDKASCIKKNGTLNNYELTVNDVIMDTISLSKSNVKSITGWYGNYVRDQLAKFYKIDTLNFKFDSTYAPMWLNVSGFYNNMDNSSPVEYSIQDLIGVNN